MRSKTTVIIPASWALLAITSPTFAACSFLVTFSSKDKEEAEAKKKAEAEEKKGYDTGITYDQLARNPDDYEGDKIKFRGKVIQVMEGDGETQIRIAVNSNIDTILYGAFDASLVESRILEDDIVTLMGISAGLLSYESTMGGNITIPSMLIFDIDQ